MEEVICKIKWDVLVKGVEWSEMFDLFLKLDFKLCMLVLLRYYYGYIYVEIGLML